MPARHVLDAMGGSQARGTGDGVWQIKGLLLLASALVAIALVASTAGPTSKLPAPAAAVQRPARAPPPDARSDGTIAGYRIVGELV